VCCTNAESFSPSDEGVGLGGCGHPEELDTLEWFLCDVTMQLWESLLWREELAESATE